ncbi:hypothetical protein UlMin_024952 [Ulmus minor]
MEIVSDMPEEIKERRPKDEYKEMLLKLPKVKDSTLGCYYYFYQGFWLLESMFKGVVSFQQHFLAHDDDIILASCPKSGTTWLKALTFSILNRNRFTLKDSPLLVANPHDLVPVLGHLHDTNFQFEDHENIKPRLFSTHIPYASLPPTIKNSKCKIVYICRNPMDVFVSAWHFRPKFFDENIEPENIEEFFDMFCRGIHAYGPSWDHVLGFWKASLEKPDRVLFLKYEDLKRDNVSCIKKLAEFAGFPFTIEEEKQGIIEEISKLCSIEKLKNLEVNKNGRRPVGVPNGAFFRKGEVGDWINYLTPSMIEHAEKLMEEKFRDSNLIFELSPYVHKCQGNI